MTYDISISTGTQLADVVMLVGTVDVVFGSVDLYQLIGTVFPDERSHHHGSTHHLALCMDSVVNHVEPSMTPDHWLWSKPLLLGHIEHSSVLEY